MANRSRKKLFTLEQATAMLPLLRAILRDITELAENLRDRHQRLLQLQNAQMTPGHQEEMDHLVKEFERDQERMGELENEVRELGVELKDYFTGLVDFRALMDGREVYLCWKLDEPEITHWHELEAGFAGRRKLPETVVMAGSNASGSAEPNG